MGANELDSKSEEAALDNAVIGELCAQEAERVDGHVQRAFRRAARAALLWEEEAWDLVQAGRSLTELNGIGPHLARRILTWIEKDSSVPDPPIIRREFLTLTQTRKILDRHPSWRQRLRGDLHMHTTWSDGSASSLQMAKAAAVRGYSYIAITDHTKGLKIANGLNEEELMHQGEEIDSVNREYLNANQGFSVLKSTEVNLSRFGETDISGESLRKLDVVIGAFHSALRGTEDQTGRYLAAVRNKGIHIIGHPQGRIYNHREGLRADWNRVFAEVARLDKAVEIDGYPDRQDLRTTLVRVAREEGARISLGTDAHQAPQLGFIVFSLAAACLAQVPKERIINFMLIEEVREWARKISMNES